MKKVVFALLGILLILLLVAPASAWLSGFQYEKDLIINSTSPSTLTSYQVKLVVWNTTGTDSGENIYLGGHLTQPTTWNDIRFATTTDAICDIWIQESNATAAIIWMEVPYIYNGYTTVRCYYGKPLATAVSDGDATFRFYGTFAVVPLNVDKWVGVGNYTLYTDASNNSVSDIMENATSGDSSITSIDTFTYATGYEQVIRANLTQYPSTLIGLYTSDSYYAYFGMSREVNNSLITETRIAAGSNSQETTIGTGYGGAFHIWKIKRSQTGTSCLFTIDNVAVANHTLKVPTASMPMSFRSTAVNGEVIVDWAFVKKYYDPDPYVAYTNPETVESAPHTDFEGSPTFGPNGTVIYFNDLSTGVVTARNWSFGDGVYSTLQNPNHTYSTPGFYNVTLTASNSNGTDTQMKEDYIYIWSTTTPTPTPTPGGNATVLTHVVIEPPVGSAYFPIEFYVVLILIALICFTLSLMTRISEDIMGILAAVFFLILAWLSMAVDFHGITATNVNSTLVVQPYSYTPYIPYLTYIWLMLFFVALLNLYRIWHIKMVEAVEKKQQQEEDEFREEKQRRGF
jgi:PKD repeat protein